MKIIVLALLLLSACADQTDPQVKTHLNGFYSTGVAGVGR